MTETVDTVETPVRGETDVLKKIDAIDVAAKAGDGRLDPVVLTEATQIVDRAGQRLRMSGDLTIVALAGATGSGKSSLFNALTGLDLAAIGTRRPTSSMPLACVWGDEPAGEVLSWLGIPRRHQVQHRSSLEEAHSEDLDGLVLLDLPDHDSTEVEHRLIVDRLVELVDMLVWVVDPQKYADAALHNRYIKPFASHSGVMVFALNHIDKLTPDQRKSCLEDLDRLLKSDGLKSPTVVATSAVSGDGLEEVRALLVKRVSNKRSARERLSADVDRVADRMASQCGNAKTPEIADADVTELVDALSDASGLSVVADAVRRSHLQRARAATGWPLTKWVERFRPDPLRRLHGDQVSREQGKALRRSASSEVAIARSSLPAATPVQRARMDAAVRTITNKAAEGLSRPWADSVRTAIRRREESLGDELDQAVARTDLGVANSPGWWSFARIVQWLLFLVTLGGAAWLIALLVARIADLSDPPLPEWNGIPYAWIMLVGGAVLGLALSFVCRVFATSGALRRSRQVAKALRTELEKVADSHVVAPAREELTAYTTCRDSLATARG
ncbi:GTP-binding protein EngB required for normal cell division [Kribbella rubisoli]|uniref:GTP-binding protein EngB required for normal cell division n=1 Tax=Kribbella rubisoli TaxID=3075929 RepID=A0A4Q7XFP1_9ACTN|nr:GTPase [Kribbella rubisoli]RZU22181.1 GTP-binding protein EngB required for normal cell division [Kribbella rubisoli]